MKVIILAAGLGKRFRKLGSPKPLTLLSCGLSILEYQVRALTRFIPIDDIIVVVGYQKERIIECFPDLTYVYNPHYANTNTAKSLAHALRKVHSEDLLWLNGDVIFRPKILSILLTDQRGSGMIVNTASVGDEEVKYRASPQGNILAISKVLENPQGEVLGVNRFVAKDLPILKKYLAQCDASHFFEAAIDNAIQKKDLSVWSVPVLDSDCIEIDFPGDLERADQLIASWANKEHLC
jgi:choline kinase